MLRRRKKDPPEKVSPAWEKYRPGIDALYWKFGGPFIPVEDIKPEEQHPDYLGRDIKASSARLKYVVKERARCEGELAEATRYYLELHEKGIDGLGNEWLRKVDREREAEGDASWAHVPRNVDMHKASSFQKIRYFKGRIAACDVMIVRLEAPANPLLYWNGGA